MADRSISDFTSFQNRQQQIHQNLTTRLEHLEALMAAVLSLNFLLNAAKEISQGSFEANLGGHIYKKRIALGSRGKSSGARTIVAFKIKDKAIFLYGFPKNERANINQKEEIALKGLAEFFLSLSDNEIDDAVKSGDLVEVYDEQTY